MFARTIQAQNSSFKRSRRRSARFFPGVGLLVLSIVSSSVQAADEPIEAEPVEAEPWEFTVTPYLWATKLSGSATARGEESGLDVNAADILRALNFAFMGQFTVRKGRWGGFVNVLYANLGASQSLLVANVDVNVEETMLDFGLLYRVADWRDLNGPGSDPLNGGLDVYIGARYMNLGLDVDLQLPLRTAGGSLVPGPTLSGHGSKGWIDPIVGFRTRWNFTERWNVGLQADIGGGANADLTWQALFAVGYRFSLFGDNDANVLLGYRAVYEKYQEGRGDLKFALDATTHGPALGLAIRF